MISLFSLHLQQIEICSDRYDRLWQVQQIVTDSVILQISLKLMELICNFKVLLCKIIVITVISNLVKKYFISEQKWQFWKNHVFAKKLSPPPWERPIYWNQLHCRFCNHSYACIEVQQLFSSIFAGSLESANWSILAACNLFKEVVGKKSAFYVNEIFKS